MKKVVTILIILCSLLAVFYFKGNELLFNYALELTNDSLKESKQRIQTKGRLSLHLFGSSHLELDDFHFYKNKQPLVYLKGVNLSFDLFSQSEKVIQISKLTISEFPVTKGENSLILKGIELKNLHLILNEELLYPKKEVPLKIKAPKVDALISFFPDKSNKSYEGKVEFTASGLNALIKKYNKSRYEVDLKGKVHSKTLFTIPIKSELPPAGKSELTITNVQVTPLDLDQILSNYINSNNLGLTDVAGFLTLGPIGLLVSKATKTGRALPGVLGGKTQISHLEGHINLHHKKIQVPYFKMLTKENTIRAKGTIQRETPKNIDFTLAPLDNDGCVHFVQKISGTTDQPEIGSLGILSDNVIKPITNFLNSGKNLITGDCQKFSSL